jgi:hypothetical protein
MIMPSQKSHKPHRAAVIFIYVVVFFTVGMTQKLFHEHQSIIYWRLVKQY